AERFITPELKEYEEKILTAQDKVLKIENDVVQKLKGEILENSPALHQFCTGLATLDVLYSLVLLAGWPGYICPVISEDTVLDIKDGRHPIVEKTSVETFVANDTLLDCDENHLIILTGPNMSGKSTYIRQTAILTIMAQIGSFIPAAAARVGIVDKIFTRIGAHDDISKGQSTFMVEMTETADIVNNLTERSLVILDEIGRGTSTYDGLSLAWALAEHFQKTKARTLFATHFHELTALADERSGVKNYNVAVKEWKDEIIFMHKIVAGSSDDSYGIYVAKLAGIPKDVIARSRQILTQLELQMNLKEQLKSESSVEQQLSLFTAKPDPMMEQIRSVIEAMDINSLTPLDALNKLQEIKETITTNPNHCHSRKSLPAGR
ncbi:MAG: DNA mismatch repair protein MutS, partial [Candidatus Omnitrophica bacterium]|nr:DNA mismatch repair protein MutS [Candidatus Omnitrophota bacterium]